MQLPTIKFSQLLSSVKEDMHKYDAEGMIDPIRLIKVVRRCNEVLGSPIYQRKTCAVQVENFKANLPLDLYKIEMVFAVGEFKSYTSLIATGNHYEWSGVRNACMCEGGLSVCVTPLEQHQPTYTINTFTKVNLTENSLPRICKYSPNRHWFGSTYTIDIQEEIIQTSFKEGLLYISYLADLTDEKTGEVLVPFHARLNDYYEYSIKAKILEDMLVNSEADVSNVLQYIKQERNFSFTEAVDFVT